MLVLHHSPGSRSGRVKMLLDLMGLAYDLKLVDTAKDEHKRPSYLALNPFGVVPTLVHDGRPILESVAQMLHVADLDTSGTMAPRVGSVDRGTYYAWFSLSSATLEPAVLEVMRSPEDPGAQHRLQETTELVMRRVAGPFCMKRGLTAVDVLMHWNTGFISRLLPRDASSRVRDYHQGLQDLMDWTGY